MEELKQLLENILNENLLQIVISGQKHKDAPLKIKIRPLNHKGMLVFQASSWDGKKEFHKNYEAEELIPAVLVWMSRDYKQMQAETTGLSATVLVSKKGNNKDKEMQRKARTGRPSPQPHKAVSASGRNAGSFPR